MRALAPVGLPVPLLVALSACSLGATPPPVRSCADHHPAGTPPALVNLKLAAGTRPLCFAAFAILHSGVTRSPLWVAEHLTRSSVEAARALDTRDNRFHPEDRLPPAERAELADYRGSGFDRGHMAPSGDMGRPADDYESFSLANIVPQDGPLNRNGWADLEGYVRDLAGTLGEAYVVIAMSPRLSSASTLDRSAALVGPEAALGHQIVERFGCPGSAVDRV